MLVIMSSLPGFAQAVSPSVPWRIANSYPAGIPNGSVAPPVTTFNDETLTTIRFTSFDQAINGIPFIWAATLAAIPARENGALILGGFFLGLQLVEKAIRGFLSGNSCTWWQFIPVARSKT